MPTVEELREEFGTNDAVRDKDQKTPDSVERLDDLSYGVHGKWNLLDLYRPRAAEGKLPVIVSIHGGAWVYGTKEVYQFYCMSLAQRGFAVVNFNYRLAPEHPFPAALEDINEVFWWVIRHAEQYGMDKENLFVVGDSAGAQLASQYIAMLKSEEFQKLYEMKLPDKETLDIKAAALNCGLYDAADLKKEASLNEAVAAYFGKEAETVFEKVDTMKYLNQDFPPAFVMTACCDFLREHAKPMYEALKALGVPCEYHIYGSMEQEEVAHVFHCDMRLTEAKKCNDDECAFFRQYMQ